MNRRIQNAVALTTRAAGDVWSYPNIHGDIAATRVNGTVTVFNWDPYGNPVGAVPDNSAGTADWRWLGQNQRTLDHPAGLNPVIEMGTRVYQPDTGRFQQTDPIEDGTTTNPYSYVPDPINQYDLDGQCKRHKGVGGWFRDRACNIGDATHATVRFGKKVYPVVAPIAKGVIVLVKAARGCLKGIPFGTAVGTFGGLLVGFPEVGAPVGAAVGCATGAALQVWQPSFTNWENPGG